KKMGIRPARKIFDTAYQHMADMYSYLDTFPVVIDLLPEFILGDAQISGLSCTQAQKVLFDKVKKLQLVNNELSREMAKRVKMTRELRASQEMLNALINSSMDAVMSMDSGGRIMSWNNNAEKLLGWAENEVLGEYVSQKIIPPDERSIHINWFNRYLETGDSGFISRTIEITAMRRSGEHFQAECSIAPFQTANGKMFSVFLRDITRRKQYEDSLKTAKMDAEQAAAAKSEFLAIMSHEIRTPLNGVLGMTQLLNTTRLNAEQSEYVDLLMTSGNNLLAIINDVLDFSKIEAGKMEIDHSEFSLSQAIQNSVEVFMATAAEKGVRLRYDFDTNIPDSVVGDSARVGQIVMNLVSNALKFTQEGHIEVKSRCISLSDQKVWIKISIKDTGIGIDPECVEKIFESFSQQDGSTSRKFGGTGLGLAICARLVDIMGGKIGVQSVMGEGSEFHFELPLDRGKSDPVKGLIELAKTRAFVSCIADEFLLHRFNKAFAKWGVALEDAEEVLIPHSTTILCDRAGYDDFVASGKVTDKTAYQWLLVQHEDATQWLESFDTGTCVQMIKSSCTPDQLKDSLIHLANARVFTRKRRTAHRILVAEDNVINQKLIGALLEKMGYEFDIVENGKLAVEFCLKQDYAMVFMDIQMPEMDGLEATRIIQQEVADAPPILALTANATEEDRRKCLDSGMVDFLSKPFQLERLEELLLRYTAEVQPQDQK
ncbi:MAG: response regulator, partial [Flavobacteriales bacterium]|nr:response regulator [Flavobacteriales bacterium]